MNIIMALIFSPVLFGIVFYVFRLTKPYAIVISQGIIFVFALFTFLDTRAVGARSYVVGGWSIGKGVGIYLDTLSASMILLTAFLFFLLLIHEWNSIESKIVYIFLLFALESLLFALFVSYDLFNIFVLMEVSTILVTILIIFKKKAKSYYDGLIYLLINIIGMSFFLFGVGYVYRMYGVYDLNLLKEALVVVPESSSSVIMYALLMTGITLKIGAVPVFTWLPRAHGSQSAPSIVSAILSGIYINIVFIYFIRLQDVFSVMFDTRILFLIIGLLTAFVGGFLALVQEDIKKLLGYSTVSQIGFILIGLNVADSVPFYGSAYHIFSHSFFKALLFLIAGVLIEQYKTRKLSEIRGVFNKTPLVGVCTILGILGITGAPFFNGSIGKYLISTSAESFFLEIIMYGINFLTILYLAKFSMILYGRGEREKIETPKAIVFVVLGVICLMGGIMAPAFMNMFFRYELYINTASYLSKAFIYILSVLVGFFVYKKILHKSEVLNFIRHIEVSFNFIVVMIFVLFVSITGFIYITH
ncbi:multisubunit sodium/proton antiporter MrpD subunit [Natranaerovirga pectinivora]|uniref:Multisubunit sodium/proton antiporter MrpD subunit n=1 Tax=Natranaerovirga pectinivora TaxID=682400 RepID=A0A4R3MN52_9FIRM|nr:proton-conducting transporter membrane subunit [Natranaerovirga pectinivora]TCT15454.1 multisubunit sodium/proton antiporter MrpD subunit [Natranaerovirga pectinivora]